MSYIRITKNLLYDKSNWDRALLQWDKYTSPFRPSCEDIKNYSLIFNRLKMKNRVLVLGATPEIREILSKFDSSIIIADFSFKMISGMIFFNKSINETKEKWIKSDWMALDKFIKNNYFDVIVGDLFLRNINPQLQLECLRKISRLLKKGGYLITRIHLLNEDITKLSSKKIIRNIFDKELDIDNKLIEDLITSRLFDKNTDFNNKIVNKEAFTNNIKENIKKGVKSKREKLILNNILKKWSGPKNYFQRIWTQRTKKEIEGLLLKYFVVHDIRIASDYKDSEFYPIYVLKNSKNKK